jgi:hypothetical protein
MGGSFLLCGNFMCNNFMDDLVGLSEPYLVVINYHIIPYLILAINAFVAILWP